jgi:hypothetical protein
MGDIVEVIQDILETDRAFFDAIPLLQGSTRNHLVAAHLRNTSVALTLLRTMLRPATLVVDIPVSVDAAGNFFDRVPVVATPEQITAAVERQHVVAAGTVCSICQDTLTCSSRIRSCGHTFHGACLDQWLQLNPRCPVCRYDVRSLQSPSNPTPNE